MNYLFSIDFVSFILSWLLLRSSVEGLHQGCDHCSVFVSFAILLSLPSVVCPLSVSTWLGYSNSSSLAVLFSRCVYRYIPLAMNVSIVPVLKNVAASAAMRSDAITLLRWWTDPCCDLNCEVVRIGEKRKEEEKRVGFVRYWRNHPDIAIPTASIIAAAITKRRGSMNMGWSFVVVVGTVNESMEVGERSEERGGQNGREKLNLKWKWKWSIMTFKTCLEEFDEETCAMAIPKSEQKNRICYWFCNV
jgi:hypothetical protein